MWYILLSIISVIAIFIEQSNKEKKLYIILSALFPTIGYSLWRVYNTDESDNNTPLVSNLCYWFAIMHTAQALLWFLAEYYSTGFTSNKPAIIIISWIAILAVAFLLSIIYRVEGDYSIQQKN